MLSMKRAILILTLACAACDLNLFGPEVEYVNRRPLVPVPSVYAEWYAAVEECLGMRGDFGAVRWWIASDVRLNSTRKTGVLDFPNDITMWAAVTDEPWAVGHEMSHHILKAGDWLHDERGLVPCQFAPMQEASGH